ncbi:MAG: 3'-5' exonuclease [Spirochaetales bacterium]|nr:3'-5' exonuclease [Spirochaetales bacterium]
MDFCAIDFETANYQRDSACSVGIVKVVDGQIVETFYSLINQKDLYFVPKFIDIHGIYPRDTANSPSFAQLWPEMQSFIGSYPLVAHNSGFDMGVLAAMLKQSSIDWVLPKSFCTCKGARRTWPFLHKYGLSVVSNYLKIDLDHHNALSDAQAAALIMLEILKERGGNLDGIS